MVIRPASRGAEERGSLLSGREGGREGGTGGFEEAKRESVSLRKKSQKHKRLLIPFPLVYTFMILFLSVFAQQLFFLFFFLTQSST